MYAFCVLLFSQILLFLLLNKMNTMIKKLKGKSVFGQSKYSRKKIFRAKKNEFFMEKIISIDTQ